ncbi:MAG: hypothetical protein R3D98_00610 [Candidatus Krumholzibacteriia bacterium]
MMVGEKTKAVCALSLAVILAVVVVKTWDRPADIYRGDISTKKATVIDDIMFGHPPDPVGVTPIWAEEKLDVHTEDEPWSRTIRLAVGYEVDDEVEAAVLFVETGCFVNGGHTEGKKGTVFVNDKQSSFIEDGPFTEKSIGPIDGERVNILAAVKTLGKIDESFYWLYSDSVGIHESNVHAAIYAVAIPTSRQDGLIEFVLHPSKPKDGVEAFYFLPNDLGRSIATLQRFLGTIESDAQIKAPQYCEYIGESRRYTSASADWPTSPEPPAYYRVFRPSNNELRIDSEGPLTKPIVVFFKIEPVKEPRLWKALHL